jgi:hypothetical protein
LSSSRLANGGECWLVLQVEGIRCFPASIMAYKDSYLWQLRQTVIDLISTTKT